MPSRRILFQLFPSIVAVSERGAVFANSICQTGPNKQGQHSSRYLCKPCTLLCCARCSRVQIAAPLKDLKRLYVPRKVGLKQGVLCLENSSLNRGFPELLPPSHRVAVSFQLLGCLAARGPTRTPQHSYHPKATQRLGNPGAANIVATMTFITK